jgi:glycosyltransferase involved in cell wall biosynthesis
MRVLHILDHSLPLQSGYTFRTRAILKAQIARGWEVASVSGPRQGRTDSDVEMVDGLRFFRTDPVAPALAPIGEWREIGRFAQRIAQVARDFRPDILHVHSPVLSAMAAQRAARRLRLPLVYEIRAFWEDAAVGNGEGREGSWKYRSRRARCTRPTRSR